VSEDSVERRRARARENQKKRISRMTEEARAAAKVKARGSLRNWRALLGPDRRAAISEHDRDRRARNFAALTEAQKNERRRKWREAYAALDPEQKARKNALVTLRRRQRQLRRGNATAPKDGPEGNRPDTSEPRYE
jgi:hypothetical protein